MSNTQEDDYLDEDKPFRKPINAQNFCLISMLTPNVFPEEKRSQFKDQKILGIKIRGTFEKYEDAKERCDYLIKRDKYHNIFVGEVGKWLPFDVDMSELKTQDDVVYREKELNTYMKAYKESLDEETLKETARKDKDLENSKVVTGQVKMTGNDIIADDEDIEDVENNKESEFSNQKSVEEKINSTHKEKEELEEKLKTNEEQLESFAEQIKEMKSMFSSL